MESLSIARAVGTGQLTTVSLQGAEPVTATFVMPLLSCPVPFQRQAREQLRPAEPGKPQRRGIQSGR